MLANAKAGNFERARSGAESLLASRDTAELHHLLGDVQERTGHPLEAVRQYQKAAEMDPNEAYLFDWGSELLLHHAPEPAIDVFTQPTVRIQIPCACCLDWGRRGLRAVLTMRQFEPFVRHPT